MRPLLTSLSILTLCACSGAPTAPSSEPPQPSKISQPIAVAGEATSALSEELLRSLEGAEVILIGETHDHPQHHALQAELIRRLSPKSVAFEMLNASQAEAASTVLSKPSDQWDKTLSWSARGWPEFSLYQPVFEAAREVGAQVIAAHPDRITLQPLMLGKPLPELLVEELKLDQPLPKEAQEELEQEIIRSHCGHAPKAMIGPMVQAQRLKDAWMARALIASPKPAVMIVGRGHTQERRGIPWALGQLTGPQAAPKWVVISLRSDDEAKDHLEGSVKVIKTKPHRVDDPCERFKEQLKKMGERHKGE